MKRGVLLRRVFLVVMLSLLLTVLFTVLIYASLSKITFTSVKSAELMPKARALGVLVSGCMDDSEQARNTRRLLKQMDQSVLGAYLIVVDADGKALLNSEALSENDFQWLSSATQKVLAGEEVTFSGETGVSKISMVGVGTPILREGQVVGGVLIFLPMYEALAALSSLNGAMMLSLMCVIPIVLALVYLLGGHIVRPLRQMRDVAMAMAAGDYTARADDSQKGEMGQLAASLNHLSRELRRTIGDLTVERNRLKQSIDGLSEGFVSVNSLGRVTHHNPAVSQMFAREYVPGDVQPVELIPEKGVWDDFEAAIQENRIILRDINVGGQLIHCTISPLAGENGEVAGAVGLFSDITESERLERTRRDYVANVSHELRTPLTAMRALIEPLRDGMVRSEEARARYYDIILRETMRLSRLINDLMELSRLQSGKLSVDASNLFLGQLIQDLDEKYSAAAEEHGQTFRLLFDPNLLPQVCTNADRVEQVLVILLDNAMKYTPEGGTISLDAAWNEERVVLKVRDTGIGISESDLPYVFDRFYKADKSRTGSSGSGLGLSIAREMLRWMGEDIMVASESGKGSEFSFTVKRTQT